MISKPDWEPQGHKVGQRLLLNYIDKCALGTPNKIAFYQVLLDGPHEKVVPLTYANVRNLVDQLAWWLDGLRSDQHRKNDTTIAYLGPSDLRHLLLALACNRIGTKALLLSPRNSAHIHAHLIKECDCDLLIFDHTVSDIVDCISHESKIIPHNLKDLFDLLKTKTCHTEALPYPGTWASEYSKLALILQTSGSTGLPKPVPITHAAIATLDAQLALSDQYGDGRKCQLEVLVEAKRPYQSFPFFHVAGFELTCFFLFAGCCPVLGPPHRPSGIETYKEVVEMAQPDAALLAPQTVNEIAEDKELMLRVVPKLQWICYGGGPITEKAGNTVSSRTRLINAYGSTECGSIPLYPTQAPYWNCHHFHPLSGADLRPVPDTSDLYELFIVRDETTRLYQSVFQNFPELKEFRVKDMFRRHPDKEDYWIYQGRKDDIIVLSTGEKINPLPMENAIASVPGVRAALVVGNRQPYPALLVDLKFDAIFEDSKQLTMDRLGKALASTNIQGSRDAHIRLEDVIWTDPQRPLARNAKGNLRRSAIERDYEDHINRLYEKEINYMGHNLDASSEQTLSSGLLQMSRQLVSRDDLDIDDDLFESGLDSRGSQILMTAIKKALSGSDENRSSDSQKQEPSVDLVYKSPTVRKLTMALFQNACASEKEGHTDERGFHRMLQQHVDNISFLRPRESTKNTPERERVHVLLTGSTGFVGSYVLDSLSRCSKVERITCLDRRTETRAASFDDNHTSDSSKVEYLLGSLDKDDFDLDRSICSTLLGSVTVILHCQWPVNFNQPLTSFQPSIKGVENLIRFAHDAKHNPQIIFLSSVATVKQWDQGTPVPDKPLSDPRNAQTGYGQSKLLASRLLEEAGKHIGTRSSICRLGQVTGPVGGIVKQKTWPRTNWFPILLDASRIIGCLPDSLGTAGILDWIPVDEVAKVITSLVVSKRSTTDRNMPFTDFYHLVNPEPRWYKEVLPVISTRLGEDVKIVSLSEWVDRLEKSAETREDTINPGLTLLSFFQGLKSTQDESPVVLDTKNTQQLLPELGKIGAVNGTYMETLLDQWGFDSRN